MPTCEVAHFLLISHPIWPVFEWAVGGIACRLTVSKCCKFPVGPMLLPQPRQSWPVPLAVAHLALATCACGQALTDGEKGGHPSLTEGSAG